MNNKLKVVLGTIAGMIIGGAAVVGANQTIQAILNNKIVIRLNGQYQEFTDETTGEIQYPITYHDRTYLPLRNIAQLAGLKVGYNNESNTAWLYSNNISINALTYDDMVEKLKLYVYSNQEKATRGIHSGIDVNRFIFDIDNDYVPEIFYTGNSILAQPEDCLQIYTIKNNKVVSTVHEFSLVLVPCNVFQAEDGVYVVERTGDGPESYSALYKLELENFEVTKQEIIRIDSNLETQETSFRVDGKEVDIDTYNKKISELENLKITKMIEDDDKWLEEFKYNI